MAQDESWFAPAGEDHQTYLAAQELPEPVIGDWVRHLITSRVGCVEDLGNPDSLYAEGRMFLVRWPVKGLNSTRSLSPRSNLIRLLSPGDHVWIKTTKVWGRVTTREDYPGCPWDRVPVVLLSPQGHEIGKSGYSLEDLEF